MTSIPGDMETIDLGQYTRDTLMIMRRIAAALDLWDNVTEIDRRIALIGGAESPGRNT